jgi:uncharacterized protein (TIGR03086 family)
MSTTPAAEFREIGGRFGALADGVRPDQWDGPSPVAEWRVRDVVRHLVEWFPAFLAGGAGIELPPGPSVDDDPAGAWRHLQDQVQALLDDPASAERVVSNPHIGDVPLPQAVSQFFTADVFMHSWDLARASGQDDTLDPGRCVDLLSGMQPIEELMRGSGQYGARVPVPDDADPQTKMLGFIGRDPEWSAPRGDSSAL